jgi:hypothetical protein
MRWRALTDLTLPSGDYIQAGSSFDSPANWRPPTNAVQPMDAGAVAKYWAEGPRGVFDAEPWRAVFTNGARWTGVPVPAATMWWVPVRGGAILHGAESFGVHPPVA